MLALIVWKSVTWNRNLLAMKFSDALTFRIFFLFVLVVSWKRRLDLITRSYQQHFKFCVLPLFTASNWITHRSLKAKETLLFFCDSSNISYEKNRTSKSCNSNTLAYWHTQKERKEGKLLLRYPYTLLYTLCLSRIILPAILLTF